jgi:hypothetical protein
MKKKAVMAEFKLLPRHFPPGGTEKDVVKYQDDGSPGRDLNTGLPEYEMCV